MTQMEFLEGLRIMINTGAAGFGCPKEDILYVLDGIEEIVRDYYRTYIITELQREDCLSLEDLDCVSWSDVFGECDGENYSDFCRMLFTEQELKEIWLEAHPEYYREYIVPDANSNTLKNFCKRESVSHKGWYVTVYDSRKEILVCAGFEYVYRESLRNKNLHKNITELINDQRKKHLKIFLDK